MVVTGYNYLSNLYEHWLNDAQPMEFFKTSFYISSWRSFG